MTIRKSNRKRQCGFVAVETAMIMPLLILLVLGLVDFGRFMWVRNVTMDAAAEGARLAVLADPVDAEVVSRVRTELHNAGVVVEPVVTVGPREAEQLVNVDVSVPFEFLVLSDLIPGMTENWSVSVTSMMLHER